LWDWAASSGRWLCGRSTSARYSHCPSVCVIVAGYNEAETIEGTLASLWGSYPRLEIVVVDDGSLDGMAEAARRFARRHAGVSVFRRPQRGGKSSAMNFALRYTNAEVVVVVDADSSLGPSAIWEIVQPLADLGVGAVSGAVLARNPFVNLCTWLQAYEYLSTIFISRMVSARLGILGIVSGAFGAFRRAVLEQVHGWDVGPPEDLDLTLTIRKAGHQIAFAPYSYCYTDVPERWKALAKQRQRWEQSGVIRNHCRKHLDMASFWSAGFLWSNLFVFLESWFFNVFCMYGIWAWAAWFFLFFDGDHWQLLLALYLSYLAFELVQVLTTLYYTNHPARDLLISIVFPLVPFYQILLLTVRLVATTGEIFFRKSFDDNYVPAHVRAATWRW
jgi:cellulose synthase/poly-beta-1,6-N-acetylglucosamine synthase-like glycosyltransferase